MPSVVQQLINSMLQREREREREGKLSASQSHFIAFKREGLGIEKGRERRMEKER